MDAKQKRCFVIAPIGDEGSTVRIRSDQVFRHIVEPACGTAGYEVLRAEQLSEPGLITSQIIGHIVEDELVVADLTGSNPNVYYELAIRHMTSKPVVQLMAKGEMVPFDLSGVRTLFVDMRDVDSVAAARNELVRSIEAVSTRREGFQTPFSIARQISILRDSANTDTQQLGNVVNAIQELRLELQQLTGRLEGAVRTDPQRGRIENTRVNFAALQFLMNKGESLANRAIEKEDQELAAYAQSIIENVSTLLKNL